VSFALEEPLSDRSALAEGVVGANPIEPQTYLVELKEITKAYGPTLAAADIDFAVAASDVIGLVGGQRGWQVDAYANLVRHHRADAWTTLV
jgi:hypothetical protein